MKLSEEVEKYRITTGFFKTNKGSHEGAFFIKSKNIEMTIFSSGDKDPEWEHVSVSLKNRNPNWDEMCFVKKLFWSDEDTVIQFHPKKSDYVDVHPYCLHLWKNKLNEHILPPIWMV